MNKLSVIIVALLFLVLSSVIICLKINHEPSEQQLVEVRQDNEVIAILDIAEEQLFDVVYANRVNTIEVNKQGVHIVHADCPDQICQKMGYLKQLPITCLPNHLTITFITPTTTDTTAR